MNTYSVAQKETTISYPLGFPQMMKMSDLEFVAEMRLLAAAKLYEMGRLTAGKAAQLADMPRLEFLSRLADFGVPAINLSEEEVDAEIVAALEMVR